MKKILTFIVTALLAVTACLSLTACGADENTLYVYTNAGFPPYEYVDKEGNVTGVDMELMQKIGDELGYKVVINDIEFKNIFTEIQNNKFAVGAAGITKKADRDAMAIASNVYSTSVQYVILPKTHSVKIEDSGKVELASLAGLNIGVQAGTTGSFLVEDNVDGIENDQGVKEGLLYNNNSAYTEYTNAIIASADIGKSLGAVVIDKLPAQSIVSANAELVCYELNEEPESYVLYFNKESADLVKQVNEVLDKLIKDGFIDELIVKHSK